MTNDPTELTLYLPANLYNDILDLCIIEDNMRVEEYIIRALNIFVDDQKQQRAKKNIRKISKENKTCI